MKVINTTIYLIALVATIGFFTSQSVIAKTEVKFSEPEKFRDVLVTGNSKARSLKLVNQDLNALFEQLSKDYISENETLSIEVTEIDLAGDIEPMVGPHHEDLRIIRDSDYYRLSFNFEVRNESGEIMQKGEKEIKNFVSQGISNRFSNDNTVSHFEKDLKKWFKESSFK